MKSLLNIVVLILLTNVVMAQAPQGIPYQAVARNSSGAILASTSISVRFTIRDSVATGAIKYRETFSVTTTAQGMFNVNVGQGTPVIGTFSGINWGTNTKFMKVEMDPAGGSSYIDMGTTQMMSVPYSKYAEKAGGLSGTSGIVINSVLISTTTPYNVNGINTVFVGGGNVLFDGGFPVLERGICWSTSSGPTTALSTKTNNGQGIGSFASPFPLQSLNPSTTYYIRAYVVNSAGTYYGNEVTYTTPNHAIGLNFQGGILGYIFQPGDSGYIAGEIHGLIASPSDISDGIGWGCNESVLGGTSVALGTGASNTAVVSSACGTSTAARVCSDLVLGGYSDWYLPSIDEALKLYENRVSIGGFTSIYNYWSSSEINAANAYIVNVNAGTGAESNGKVNYSAVRAIRSF